MKVWRLVSSCVAVTTVTGVTFIACLASFNMGYTGLVPAVLLQLPSMILVGFGVGLLTNALGTNSTVAIGSAPIGWITGSLVVGVMGGMSSSGQPAFWLPVTLFVFQVVVGVLVGILPTTLGWIISQE